MTTPPPRLLAAAALALVLYALPAAAAKPASGMFESVLDPDRVVLCTLSDVTGHTGPCGCKIPMGGLPRITTFLDSVRALHGQTFFADAGGAFALDSLRRQASGFVLDVYRMAGVDAVALGDRDLRHGLAFLRETLRSHAVPAVCANLADLAGQPIAPASVLVKRGTVTVGFFGVMSPRADLGPVRDSVRVSDPVAAATAAVADLRRRGATVVVALASLGRTASEDLGVQVSGIDVVVAGRDAPQFDEGRRVGSALVVYGGVEGQHMGVSTLTLDAARKVSAASAVALPLGPWVREAPSIRIMVKLFEDMVAAQNHRALLPDSLRIR